MKFLEVIKVPSHLKTVGDEVFGITQEYCTKWGYDFVYETEIRNNDIHWSLDFIDAILFYLQSPQYDFEWLHIYVPQALHANFNISNEDVLKQSNIDKHNLLTMSFAVYPYNNQPILRFNNLHGDWVLEESLFPRNIIINNPMIKRTQWAIDFFKTIKADKRIYDGDINKLPKDFDKFEIVLANYFEAYSEYRQYWKNVPVVDWVSMPPKEDTLSYNNLCYTTRFIDENYKKYFNKSPWAFFTNCVSLGAKNDLTVDIINKIKPLIIR